MGRIESRLDELGPVARSLIARGLHGLLDDVERLPAAEHVRRGGDVLGVRRIGAIVVDALLLRARHRMSADEDRLLLPCGGKCLLCAAFIMHGTRKQALAKLAP